MVSKVDMRLDVTGMCCPLPLVELAKSVVGLDPGQVIEIIGNDPVFETTVRDFCQANAHTILDVTTLDDHSVQVRIRVGL